MYKKIFLIFLISLSLSACMSERITLVSNVDQTNANQIVLLLGQNGLSAEKEAQKNDTYTISVKKSDQIAALAILQANGEPYSSYVSFGEVFKKDSFISSPLEEHARLIYALNQEISSALSMLNGVVEVKTKVSLPLPTDNLYAAGEVKPSASVIIKYKQGQRIDLYINRIKKIVSGAVPGLVADRVEVLTIAQKED